MIDTVINTIEKYNLIEFNDHIILGVSGGADSVSLFYILQNLKTKYNLKLTVVHINHGIRGRDAYNDQEYVSSLCNKYNTPIEIFEYNIKKEAEKTGTTEEEAGRIIRYKAFYTVLKKYNADKIAVAHNMNDNAETILMRLFRGTGLKGLCGINAKRENIIRPLIECTRFQIENYCKENNINYKTDYTNNIDIYTRNKIRLKLIPWIEGNFNKNIIGTLSKTSSLIYEEDQYLNKISHQAFKDCIVDNSNTSIDINKLNLYDDVIKRRIIRYACSQYNIDLHDISYKHVDMILNLLNNKTGKSVNLPFGMKVSKQYDLLLFSNNSKEITKFCYTINENDFLYIKEINKYISLSKNKINYKSSFINIYTIIFDYDKINNVLQLRNKNEGDQIYLKGINGTKKLKKLFIDLKIPRNNRLKIPVLACKNNVLWIMDYKTSDYYKADDTTTNKIYLQIWEEILK